MIETAGLYNTLVELGHSEAWATKKVSLTHLDNIIEKKGMQIDFLLNSGKPYSSIAGELDNLNHEVNKLQDEREEMYSELQALDY